MPTYDYKCESCRAKFSRIETMTKHVRSRPSCPKCKSREVRRVFAPFYAKTVRKS